MARRKVWSAVHLEGGLPTEFRAFAAERKCLKWLQWQVRQVLPGDEPMRILQALDDLDLGTVTQYLADHDSKHSFYWGRCELEGAA